MEPIKQILEHVKMCSENKNISVESALNIFTAIMDPKFMKIFDNNDHIIGAIKFYHKILLLEHSIESLNDVKVVIKELFTQNTESTFTNTQSTIVMQCMQIIMNILFLKCLEHSPNENKSSNSVTELKYIIALIEEEDKIKLIL